MFKLYLLPVHPLLLLGAHMLGTRKPALVEGFLVRPTFSAIFCKLCSHEEVAKVGCMQRFVTLAHDSGDRTHRGACCLSRAHGYKWCLTHFAQSNQTIGLLFIHLLASLTICSDLTSNVLPCIASKGGRNCFSFSGECLLWLILSRVKWWYWSRDLNLNSLATELFFISNELNSPLDNF